MSSRNIGFYGELTKKFFQLTLNTPLIYSSADLKLIFSVCDKPKVEPRSEKTGLLGLRPGLTQTGLYNHRRSLEASKFRI